MLKLLQHKTAATILMIGIWIIGALAYLNMPIQIYPTVDENTVMADIALPDLSVSEIEDSIARPMERQLKGVDGLDNVVTVTSEGLLSAFVTFNDSVSSQTALFDVNRIVNAVAPSNAQKIVNYYQNADVVANVAILFENGEVDYDTLSRFASELEDYGITDYNLMGAPAKEIYINVDPLFMQRYGMNIDEIASQISNQLSDGTAGSVGEGAKKIFLEVDNHLSLINVENVLSELVIITADERSFPLLDVIKVSSEYKDSALRTYLNGQPMYEFEIRRAEGQSLNDIQETLYAWKETTNKPAGMNIEIYSEDWKGVMERMDMLQVSGLSGLVLVLIILLMTLNKSLAIWVAAGIPTAFAATFIILEAMGISLNLLTVFGLIMSLGIVIDDAVLVAEKALKEIDSGKEKLEAIQSSIKKMLVPLMASSLTTIAAFLPLVSIAGPLGGMIEMIPIVMVCVIAASLVEVFIILPSHLNHSKMSSAKLPKQKKWMQKFEAIFAKSAAFAIRRKYFTLFASLIIVGGMGAVIALDLVGFSFYPSTQSNYSYVSVEFAPNTTREQQRTFLSSIESAYLELDEQYPGKPTYVSTYEGVTSVTGSGLALADFDNARLFLYYEREEFVSAGMSDFEWIKQFYDTIEVPSYVKEISTRGVSSQSESADLTIAIQSDSQNTISMASADLIERIEAIEGVDEVKRNNTNSIIVYDLELKPEAKKKGILESDVKSALRNALQPITIETMSEGSFDHSIVVGMGEKDYFAEMLPTDVPVVLNGNIFRLGDIATITPIEKDSSVVRINGVRSAEFDINIAENAEFSIYELYDQIEAEIIPEVQKDYHIMFGLSGQSQHEAKAMDDMYVKSVIAIILIYIVLSISFSSYLKPVMIMSIIPFSAMGSVFGHFLLGYDFSALSLLSIFGLSGIVVNNSIAIMHEYQFCLEEYKERSLAMVIALKNRFRAILVTTITTMAGLVPLVLSQSLAADYLKPMAISLIFGLIVAVLMVCYTFPALMMIGKNTKTLKGDMASFLKFDSLKAAITHYLNSRENVDVKKIDVINNLAYKDADKVERIAQKLKLA